MNWLEISGLKEQHSIWCVTTLTEQNKVAQASCFVISNLAIEDDPKNEQEFYQQICEPGSTGKRC